MSSKKAPKNKYVTNSHLSERKFRELLRLFCADVTALSAASLTGLNRNTVNRYYGLLKRGGKVYTQIVPDVTRRTLMQVIEGKVSKDSTMYTTASPPTTAWSTGATSTITG